MATGLPPGVSAALELTSGVWTEVGTRTQELNISKGGGAPGTLTFTLENFDGALTPDSPLGSYYPNFTEGKRIRVQVRTTALGAANLLSTENASFEGGTVGNWAGNPFGYTASTVANTATFAQFGTKALLTTWPTAGAGASANQLAVSGLVIGRTYTLSAYVRVPASNPAVRIGELFGTVTMTAPAGFSRTSSTTGAFQRIAVTFDATSDTHFFGLVNSTAATAGQTVVMDGVQLDDGSTVGTFTTTAPSVFTRFVGRLSKLLPVFGTSQAEDTVQVTATDLLGDLARMKMRPLAEMLITSGFFPAVQAAYPMTDPTGRRGATDLLGDAPPLRVISGGSAGKITYQAVGDLGADGQQFVRLEGRKALGNLTRAFSLDPTGAGTPALTICVRIPEAAAGTLFGVSRGRYNEDGFVPAVYVQLADFGTGMQLNLWTQDPSGIGSLGTAIPVEAGWLTMQLGWLGGNVYLDLSDGRGTAAADANTQPYNRLIVGSIGDFSLVNGGADTSIAYAIVNTGGGLSYLAHALEGSTTAYPYSLFTALTYFNAATGMTSLGGAVAVSSTPNPLREFTAIPYADRSGLDVLLDIARSESGIVYHDYSSSATQTVKILSREDSRPLTVAMTIDAVDDIDADGDPPQFDRGLDTTVYQATASSPEDSVTRSDTTLANMVGTTGVDIATITDDRFELVALAHDAIATAKYRELRVASVTIDLVTAQNNLYATAFAVTEGERVRLTSLTTARFGQSYLEGYVDKHTEVIRADRYAITWGLLPADAPPEAHFDDSTYGRFAFGDGICTVTGGTAVGVTGTGTITLTWSGSSTLSTTAGDYPMDFDWNGERVTVTAAPAGSTSPQTLTITARGVGNTVARAHAAGEPIDVWAAARFAL